MGEHVLEPGRTPLVPPAAESPTHGGVVGVPVHVGTIYDPGFLRHNAIHRHRAVWWRIGILVAVRRGVGIAVDASCGDLPTIAIAKGITSTKPPGSDAYQS